MEGAEVRAGKASVHVLFAGLSGEASDWCNRATAAFWAPEARESI